MRKQFQHKSPPLVGPSRNSRANSFTRPYDPEKRCPVCHRDFPQMKGLLSHLSTSQSCKGYKKGKLRELDIPKSVENAEHEPPEEVPMDIDKSEEDAGGEWEWAEPGPESMAGIDVQSDTDDGPETSSADEQSDGNEEILDFAPMPANTASSPQNQVEEGEAGPSRVSNTHDLDDYVVEEHPQAGQVIRMGRILHEQWKGLVGEGVRGGAGGEGSSAMRGGLPSEANVYAPFASELDWKVARWAVQDGVGHGSFDRLLSIPGVGIHSFEETKIKS